jgi:hypothetical protein
MKNSLPAILRLITPAACLFGLSLILTGCTDDQDQVEPLSPYTHSASYGASPMALPQDLRQDRRRHQRTPHAARHHAATPSAEYLTAGN